MKLYEYLYKGHNIIILILTVGIIIITLLSKEEADGIPTTYNLGPLTGKIIVIDPGHGGADPGAMVDSIKEADLNMQLSLSLKESLEKYGATVKLTRNGDQGLVPDKRMSYFERWLILKKRKDFAVGQGCDILLSIHTNSNEDPRTSGAIVFYSGRTSRPLAEKIQKNLNLLGMRSRSVLQTGFTVIKGTSMPAVLIEAGFITNERDRNIISSKTDLIAEYICTGILQYEGFLPEETATMEAIND